MTVDFQKVNGIRRFDVIFQDNNGKVFVKKFSIQVTQSFLMSPNSSVQYLYSEETQSRHKFTFINFNKNLDKSDIVARFEIDKLEDVEFNINNIKFVDRHGNGNGGYRPEWIGEISLDIRLNKNKFKKNHNTIRGKVCL